MMQGRLQARDGSSSPDVVSNEDHTRAPASWQERGRQVRGSERVPEEGGSGTKEKEATPPNSTAAPGASPEV